MTIKRFSLRIDGEHAQVVDSDTDKVLYSTRDATSAAYLMVRLEKTHGYQKELTAAIIKEGRKQCSGSSYCPCWRW